QPTSQAYGNDRLLVVVDTSGIHELPFTFCLCGDAPKQDIQLLQLGYYPASQKRPSTVFTMRVLDAFLVSNRECNASARSFYNMLRRTTNAAFPHMVPDRYRELLRVSRQWRNMKARLFAGFGHRQDSVKPGDLAVRCPACPQPELNLPDNWKEDRERWKYTRAVVMDGNFTAQHRHMKNPADDVRLADGHTFVVGEERYKEHLKLKQEWPTENTCHDHRAVLNTAVSRGKYEATGIGAAACSRHGFFQPHSTVDFQLGERQINMDYIIHWIFAFLSGLTQVLLIYDIMCQYIKRLQERFEKSQYLSMPAGLNILGGIGQFHVHGHIPRCFPRFSLNFIRYAGIQDGEIIETLWNKINGIAGSTRGMSSAHRHELIDDRMNDSNWMKLTHIVPTLVRKWRRVCKELPPADQKFAELEAKTDAAQGAAWLAAAAAAAAGRHAGVEALDMYAVQPSPLPTKKEIQAKLMEEELQVDDINAGGETSWVAAGLRLEERKLSVAYTARCVGMQSTDAERIGLADQRQKLARAIATFHKAAERHFGTQPLRHLRSLPADQTRLGSEWDLVGDVPQIPVHREDIHHLQPETLALALPSTFGAEYLTRHGLTGLSDKELQLRKGQMNDCLQAIRIGIGHKSMVFRKKVRQATSTQARLRSFDEVHVADDALKKNVRIYMQARKAAARLFLPGDRAAEMAKASLLARYRTIVGDDLKASTTVLEPFTPGLRHKHEAWFWSMEDTEEGRGVGWMEDFNRMIFLRAHARRERWREEQILVRFEMECTVRYFEHMAADWMRWAQAPLTAGHRAFAERQAAMWRSLRDHAVNGFAEVLAVHQAE
ncbi:hypothetical protein OH76DRAFT_1348598, partial [Lentinus brumalis]